MDSNIKFSHTRWLTMETLVLIDIHMEILALKSGSKIQRINGVDLYLRCGGGA